MMRRVAEKSVQEGRVSHSVLVRVEFRRRCRPVPVLQHDVRMLGSLLIPMSSGIGSTNSSITSASRGGVFAAPALIAAASLLASASAILECLSRSTRSMQWGLRRAAHRRSTPTLCERRGGKPRRGLRRERRCCRGVRRCSQRWGVASTHRVLAARLGAASDV